MKVIDLSAPLYNGMPVYPGDPEVSIEVVHTHEKNSWELRQLSLGSHTGTHVDAFSHMHPEGSRLDEMELTRFIGSAMLVDLDAEWPSGVGLLFSEEVGTAYFDRIVGVCPGFVGGELSVELERALLGQGIVTYSGLVNLDRLPRGLVFTFIGLPLNILAGDGSPVRAVALLAE